MPAPLIPIIAQGARTLAMKYGPVLAKKFGPMIAKHLPKAKGLLKEAAVNHVTNKVKKGVDVAGENKRDTGKPKKMGLLEKAKVSSMALAGVGGGVAVASTALKSRKPKREAKAENKTEIKNKAQEIKLS